jgi:hypothetical protein
MESPNIVNNTPLLHSRRRRYVQLSPQSVLSDISLNKNSKGSDNNSDKDSISDQL